MNPAIAEINQKGLFPVPGHSLTASPEEPAPYEGPPQFTNVHEAVRFVWGNLIEEDTYVEIVQLLDDRTPIMDLVKGILFMGFQEGKWDSNLMMLLTEPLMYMILALAERVGIDPVFEDEDVEVAEDYENETKGMSVQERIESTKLKGMESRLETPPENAVPEDVMEDIQNLPTEKTDSLLAARK